LAVATASDRDMVATLTATNAKLTAQLEASQAYVKKQKDDIADLKMKMKPAWQSQRPAKTTNNDNYCWLHGYEVHSEHTSATCKNTKDGHKKDATKNNPMGVVKWGNECCAGADKVIDLKPDQFSLTLDCTPSTSLASMNDTATLDSGCTINLLSAATPCINKRAAHVPLHVNMPNGTSIQSSHTSELLLGVFPPQARKANIFPGLVHNSLISVGNLCDSGCDSGCDVVFTRNKVEVTKDRKCGMSGIRDQQSRLWRADLEETSKTKYSPVCNHAHETSNLKELINYLHATVFSPVKSTCIKAIKNGNFASWSGLTEHAVEKYLSKSAATVKGHLKQQMMYARSTQLKKEKDCDVEAELELNKGVKTHCIYAAILDAGRIYTDQTGRFPVISSRGNVSIMVSYEYDVHAIMAEPIKNNKARELLRSFQVTEQKLTARGLTPKLVTLDNEALKLLKDYLHDQHISFKLVPPYCHCHNAEERAINSYKDHFIAGLCSTDKVFPMHLWDRLLPQAILTLNMLITSRINPKIYAATHLDGQYDCNRAPMAPPGTRIIAHETPNDRQTWASHGQDDWYIGLALEHY
jgi:hypothetical protein